MQTPEPPKKQVRKPRKSSKNPTLTVERLKFLLDYDPKTGIFTRKNKPRMGLSCGRDGLPGFVSGGYRRMAIDGVEFKMHRLAWFYVYHVWPSGDIDHINGIGTDNRIENLRDVSHKVNIQNSWKPSRSNKSGFLGVYASRGRWQAQISKDGRCLSLGFFDTPEEAHQAYVQAKRLIHPESIVGEPNVR